MYGAVIHGAGDVRYEERAYPSIQQPSDAVVRTVATCVCGSDLWRYRGITEVPQATPIGHEYIGVVEEVGDAVASVKPGDFVIGGFTTSDNTCPACRMGIHTSCVNRTNYDGCQAEYIRVANADGTLVATPDKPTDDLLPSLLTLSDVMCTGWHGAVSANIGPGVTAVIVGDGAVGLCATLAAWQLGAERVISLSRHAPRQAVARDFGATDIIPERGEECIARIKEMTEELGADCVVECVGTEQARKTAVDAARPGGSIGLVGVPHGDLPVDRLFWDNKHLAGGVAPVRKYLPELLDLVWKRKIEPGKVFDLELPLNDVSEAYRAMDERRAIKAMLRP
ncbi:zinc-dependent alcohol dehydrogenase family protein [Actinobaculum sp. 352]|uniref:zinc-dependent alcohol dehydrogenase family protein n=1 Tax=Actinobaculum sp. 352 TaxID=2490946 RepID=UPI000F7EDE8F|nr:zinc-dependent alcohol dehydrogenase family protein [Actinobaculum sp. 352]RTE49247.1 IMP dehydrogenase [Actinobaculum sp. 352]